MARLYFFVEGQTEQTFADTVLKPHLANLEVYMHGPILVAHCRKRGSVHRGGGRNYVPMRNDILRFLKQEKGDDVFFTTMIDLYGLQANFPGIEEAEKFRSDPQLRVNSLEAACAEDIGDPRFVPYLQLHEFEGLLFSDPSHFRVAYTNSGAQIAILKAIADTVSTPELINDGFTTAPSKRIIAVFPDYKGAKRIVGPQVAESIGLNEIRSKCPHFDDWITKLENLGVH
jgi:hypothetical protein